MNSKILLGVLPNDCESQKETNISQDHFDKESLHLGLESN
jgi:hypothetical protein